jgi:NAD(P)-dependent dehydrogenase (short-subunit alcohol dehydrogenase family)
MAVELARHGIRVNALAPGNFETDMHQDFVAQGYTDSLVKRIPQRRFGNVDDLDGAALLLASDAGRYITGATLAIDGGQLVGSL